MQIKMKSNKHYIRSFLTLLLLMCTTITFAHDIVVKNSDGKTIYYNYNTDGTSVSVTYQGTSYSSYSNEYTGDVVIPETVTYGGKTYSVTSIGSDAFRGCSGLTSVTTGNSVTRIGNYAFYGCSGLTSVTIPNSVTSIGSYAFYNTRIKSLTIGSGIQTIASDAFDYSSSGGGAKPIKVIWLANTPPSGYDKVGGTINYVPNDSYSGLSNRKIYPFLSSMFEVDGIKYVPVSPSERTCDAIGCVYNESAKNTKTGNTVTYKNVTMTVKNVGNYICSGNTYIKTLEYNFDGSIGSHAFEDCSGLTSVTIGNSVTSIGYCAFYECSGLKKVIVPDIKNWCSIKFDASYANPLYYAHHLYSDENTEITELVIPDDVTSIGYSAFSGCSGLASVTIPNSVTSIGSYAFQNCSGLTSVTIGNSVTSIGSDAFYNCSGLKKVIVPNFNIKKWCSIKFGDYSDNPLYYAHHLYSDENTEITELVIPDDMTSIPNYVFSGCSGLTSVTIPNSVTSIGSDAFRGCSGLKKVIVPNIDIKKWCSIKFGDYYANPLYYAHHLYSDDNTEITKLIIPNDVTSINSYAFYGCSGLTSVTIPNSVTSIGNYAFSRCSGLKSITWNAKNYPAFSSYSSNPFYSIRTQITEFIICDDMTSIPSYMCYEMSNLKSVTIPNSVTSIGYSAFYGCSGLTSVTIPNSVTSIGSHAFSACSSLKKVIVPNIDIKNWCSIKFDNYYANPLYYARHLYSDENTEITELVIPDDVTSIGALAFYWCSGLSSVIIPNSVTSIGYSAFYGCSGLTSVTIPNSVTSIGSYAFYRCSGLTSVAIGNSVTSIGSTIFSGCSGLTSVRFENSKDNTPIVLENKVFSDCPLDEVYIGRKLSYMKTSSAGYSPFYRNTTLRSVKFTDKETEISDYEFYGCTNLTDVSMGDGVKSIGTYAFSGCSSLEHFTCGRQLESIGKEAFSDCTSMTKFRTRAAVPPTCGAQALDDINKWECTLYVPTESIDDYQAADQWKNFFFIEKFRVEGDSNGDDTVTMADANAVVNYFLAKGTDGFVEGDFDEEAADVNGDGEITMADANQIVNMFLGGGQ